MKTEENESELTMELHIDEIIIQPGHLLTKKGNAFGPSENDPRKLAKSMLLFLLSTFTEKIIDQFMQQTGS